MSFSFPKEEKLKSKLLFTQLFTEGRAVSKYPLKMIYIKVGDGAEVKLKTGVAVPKRNFKSAVKRNRIKRLLRESYRLNKHLIFNNIEGSFAFLFLYLGKEMPLYQEVEENMTIIFQKFITDNTDEETAK